MGILSSVGSAAEFVATSQTNNLFFLVRSPLFMQFLDICVLKYPDPLDLYAWSYEIVPIYFVAGAIDYGIMTFAISTISAFSLMVMPKISPAEADSMLSELRSPRSKAFHGLFLINFALRAWVFGLGNIKRTCNFHRLQWSEMRKLSILILILCPALFWLWLFETIFSIIKLDQNRPWLAQLFWLLLSRDWEIAGLYSGWLASKGKEVLRQESVSRLNETWGAFTLRCLKITAITTPLELFVQNLPYMVVALVIWVARNGPAIRGFVEGLINRLREVGLVEKLLKIDEAVALKRDYLLLLIVRCFCRGRVSWQRAGLRQYIAHVGSLADTNLKPIFLLWIQYFGSIIDRLSHNFGTVIQRKILGRYYKSKRFLSTTSGTLPARRFRLLQVEASSSYDQVITCNLSWYNLDSAPPYTAVSYVWGSDNRNSTIILNGEEYKTTFSGLTALKWLRSRWRKKNFWIDAICIDQTSDADKADQISIMADIYRKAKQVTIWLGPDEDGELALSLIRRLWIRTRLSGKMESSRFSLDAPKPAWKALQRLLQNPWFERSWVVQEIMSSRVIVQYGDAKINWELLSRFAMSVENEVQSMRQLYSSIDSKDSSSAPTSPLKIKYIRIMEEFRSMNLDRDECLSLLFYLIRMFRSSCRFKATNAQDRIYALLNLSGLASDVDFNASLNLLGLLGNARPQNTPDYHRRLSKLFTTVARHFLSTGPENRRLDFLAHAGTGHTYGRTRLPDLPSWVPDWSLENPPSLPLIGHDGTLELLQHPRVKGILEDVADMQSYDEISFNGRRPKQKEALEKLNRMTKEMTEKTFYRATNETLPNFTYPKGRNNLLELTGVLIDRIHSVGGVFPTSTDLKSPPSAQLVANIMSILVAWYQLAVDSFYLTNTVDNATTRLAHCMIFERTVLADLSHPTFDFTLPSAPMRPVPDYRLGMVTLIIGLASGVLTMDSLPRDEATRKRLEEILTHLNTVCSGRVFGVTEKGRMGLFLQGCETGDEVCLIEGTGVPFVLKRLEETKLGGEEERVASKDIAHEEGRDESENRNLERRELYELVGAAYVHGVMDGEGMDGMVGAVNFLLK
jgi:hypothetical protein